MRLAALRPMHWRDIPRVVALERVLYPHDAWTPAQLWAELAAPRREYVVLPEGPGAVPGEAGLLAYAGLDHGGDVCDLMTIAVAPAAQGQGLAAALLAELLGRAQARGAEAMMLEVRADNAPARRLYERAGFVELDRRRGYYRVPGGEAVDAVIMRALLPAAPAPHPGHPVADERQSA